MMKRILKAVLTVILIFSFAACADQENDGENGPDEMHQEMTEFWQDQRDEFVDLTETQLERAEEEIAQLREESENNDTIENVEEKIEELREDLAELKDEGEENWEELRNSIAESLNELQSEIENL
jgi:TolA-binding protein